MTPFSRISDTEFDALRAEGYGPIQRQRSRRVREAGRLYADALAGRIDPFLFKQAMRPTSEVHVNYLESRYPGLCGDPGGRQIGLRETMSFSDYQALFVDVLDRMYYGYYNTYPVTMYPAVRRHTLTDFRLVKRYMNDGIVSPFTQVDPAAPAPNSSLTGPVPQGGSDPATASTAGLTYQPAAFQSGTSVNWRALVNDDLGIFNDLMKRLGIEGTRGTDKFITQLFFDANGPNALLYNSGYANIINVANGGGINNPELNAQGIQAGYKVLAGMKDSSGNPILVTGRVKLIYGPFWVAAVKNLMNQMSVQVSVEGGVTNSDGFPSQFVQVNNWLASELEPIMNPYIPIVATGNPKSWLMVVDPGGVDRPAVEFGQLKGFDPPQIFQRAPSIQRVGGGLEPMMGSFDNLNQDMKIIGVMGGTQIDGRTTVGSNASGA